LSERLTRVSPVSSSKPPRSGQRGDSGDPEPTRSPDGTDPVSYEQARIELRDIVQALESGGQPLEESLAMWQRGEELAAICQQWLDGARSRLDAAIAAAES
jgi:exodeoxyribonuclease VII small subunit